MSPPCSCCVRPNASAVKELIQQAGEQLRAIASPQAAFDGYQSGSAEHVDFQMRAIFQKLRGYEIQYTSPPSGEAAVTLALASAR